MASWKKCVFKYPTCLNTQMELVIFERGNFLCRPCIHGWLEHQQLCPVCESVVGENRFTPIFGSVHVIPVDVSNNASPADQRIESAAYNGYIFSLASRRTFVSTFIIILAILCVIYLII